MTRRKTVVSIFDSDDDDSDHITSYCPRCEKYGFYTLLGERIYDINQEIPSDHDNWLQCHKCGTIVARVHAKRQDEIVGIKEPDNSIHDHGKVVIAAIDRGSKRRKQFTKNLNRPDHRINPEDHDPDLKRMLKKSGTQLIGFTEESTLK
jgi:hypothetical protein